MKGSIKIKSKLHLMAGMLLIIAGIFGFLFGICGNHIAPIVLVILGSYVYRMYLEKEHQLAVRSDVEAAVLAGNSYKTRITRTNMKSSGIERELVIDQANHFIPQRLICNFYTVQKYVRKYWSIDSFIQRMNELADKASSSLKRFVFPESLRIRLVRYITGASPP